MITKEMIAEAKKYYVDKGDNMDNPKTIQEKIHWLQVFDATALKTRCADKVHLGEYCKDKLNENICIPIIAVYERVGDIEWNKLPNQFMIKCNHGSAMNIIVRDKKTLNIHDAEKKLESWMDTDFTYIAGRELQYHDIPHRIIVEKLMGDSEQVDSLYDYKFWCFNGKPQMYTINSGHGHGPIMYYDMDGNMINLYGVKTKEKYRQPKNFSKMVEYAKKLSQDFLFVRVDFYEIDGKIYLGELTFSPGAGNFKYANPEDDMKVGNMLDLKA